TLAALVDQPLESGEGPDSYNMLPAFTGTPKKPIRNMLVISPNSPDHLSLRKGKWMYIDAQGGGGFGASEVGAHALGGPGAFPFTGQHNSDIENGKIKDDAPPAQLYNLEEDLAESTNLYEKHPKIVKEMEGILKEIRGDN
ncbi:MAG TPA: hypothetical protein VFM69_06075, partial [Pricia sp.]|nr:hypothetical protein [Pricia sp.]